MTNTRRAGVPVVAIVATFVVLRAALGMSPNVAAGTFGAGPGLALDE